MLFCQKGAKTLQWSMTATNAQLWFPHDEKTKVGLGKADKFLKLLCNRKVNPD